MSKRHSASKTQMSTNHISKLQHRNESTDKGDWEQYISKKQNRRKAVRRAENGTVRGSNNNQKESEPSQQTTQLRMVWGNRPAELNTRDQRTAKPTIRLCVSNLANDVTPAMLSNYISRNGAVVHQCPRWITKNGTQSKKFLSDSQETCEEWMDPNKWSRHVCTRKFMGKTPELVEGNTDIVSSARRPSTPQHTNSTAQNNVSQYYVNVEQDEYRSLSS